MEDRQPGAFSGRADRVHAEFMGRRLGYIYEIIDFVPGERLVMTTADGPFPMETTYTWQETQTGSTKMTLRNRGEPAAS